MRFLIEIEKIYADGGCGGSYFPKPDPNVMPLGGNFKTYWMQISEREYKTPKIYTNKAPVAKIDKRGAPYIDWEWVKEIKPTWDEWLTAGWDHKGENSARWTRLYSSGAWFMDFNDLETFVKFCLLESPVSIYEDKDRLLEDEPVTVLRIQTG